ncbi:MAG: DUF4136 domain-containing protein [Myxococcota bacterium]
MRTTTLVCLVLAACAGRPQNNPVAYETVTNPDIALGPRTTVAFVPRAEIPGYERVELPEDYIEAAREVAIPTLERLGWTLTTPDQADVLIQGAAGRRDATDSIPTAVPGRFDFQATVNSYEVDYTEATLVLDGFLRDSGEHFWHGHADTEIRSGASAERFASAVERLLVNFPRAMAPATSGSEAPSEPVAEPEPGEPTP